MANYKCGNCCYLNTNKVDFFNDNLYYCENKKKYVSPTKDGCTELVPDPKKTNNNSHEFHQTGCFFTTLIHDILKMDDDSVLLASSRNFRENYMKQNCIDLLIEYDAISPIISDNIRKEKDQNNLARNICNYYFIPFVMEIKLGNYEHAIKIFVELLNYFKNKYQIANIDYSLYQNYDINTLGKARRKTI